MSAFTRPHGLFLRVVALRSLIVLISSMCRLVLVVAFHHRLGDQIAQRTGRLRGAHAPVEAVLPSRAAPELLRIQAGELAVARLTRVGLLHRHVVAADVDHPEFVAADAARDHLVSARVGVELPPATDLRQGHGERPLLVADHQFLFVRTGRSPAPGLPHGDGHHLAVVSIATPGRPKTGPSRRWGRRSPSARRRCWS
ncbi:MAG: hypothetical protein MZV64_04850 [Ignavibacteriales bacterium]|nr:hypothetical protein [Ignavibacteriales bacterium]